jgi:hypothetical protein
MIRSNIMGDSSSNDNSENHSHQTKKQEKDKEKDTVADHSSTTNTTTPAATVVKTDNDTRDDENNKIINNNTANHQPDASSNITTNTNTDTDAATVTATADDSKDTMTPTRSTLMSKIENQFGQSCGRVKLYQLNDVGEWEDKGTGHVEYHVITDIGGEKMYVNPAEGDTDGNVVHAEYNSLVICVRHEDSGSILLLQPIERGMEYQRQGDTIIAWCEAATALDLALSFQEIAACIEIWQQIELAAQRMDNMKLIHADISNHDDLQHQQHGNHMNNNSMNDDTRYAEYEYQDVTLPVPDLNNLEELAKQLSNISIARRTGVVKEIAKDKYAFLKAAYQLLITIEELEQFEQCQYLFIIVKNLLLLNEASVVDFMTKSSRILDTIGCLEYDPDLSSDWTHARTRHRDFMRNSTFKVIVKFSENAVFNKIIQSYYITYIRDVILPHHIEEPSISSLSSMLYLNSVHIITHLVEDEGYLFDLFAVLEQFAPLAHAKKNDPLPAYQALSSTQSQSSMNKNDSTNELNHNSSTVTKSDSTVTEPVDHIDDDTFNKKIHSKRRFMNMNGNADADQPSHTIVDASMAPTDTEQSDTESVTTSDEHIDEISGVIDRHSIDGEDPTSAGMMKRKSLKRSLSGQQNISGTKRSRVVKPVGIQVDVIRTYNIYETRKQIFLYFQELVNLCKGFQPPVRDRFYTELMDLDLLPTLHTALQHTDPTDTDQLPIWLACCDMIAQFLANDAERVRLSVYSKNDPPSSEGSSLFLFKRLLEVLTIPAVDTGLMQQISYIIRTLMDPDVSSMDSSSESMLLTAGTDAEQNIRDHFLAYMYKYAMPQYICDVRKLATEFMSSTTRHTSTYTALFFGVDLLTFFAQQHNRFFKEVAIEQKVLTSIIPLLQLHRTEMKCAVIRFLRNTLVNKDQEFVAEIVDKRLLDDVIDAFIANGARYNLLNSVILELMHFIRVENIRDLVAYLAHHHLNRLQYVTYVDTFKQLQTRYEQNNEVGYADVDDVGSAEDIHESQSSSHTANGIEYHKKSDLDLDDIAVEDDEDEDTEHESPNLLMRKTSTESLDGSSDEAEFDNMLQLQRNRRRISEEDDDGFVIRKSPLLTEQSSASLSSSSFTSSSSSTVPPAPTVNENHVAPSSGGLSIKLTLPQSIGASSGNKRLSRSPTGSPTALSSPTISPKASSPIRIAPGNHLKTPPSQRPSSLSPSGLSPILINAVGSPGLAPLDSSDPDATDILVNRKRASPNMDAAIEAKRMRMLDHALLSQSTSPSQLSTSPPANAFKDSRQSS